MSLWKDLRYGFRQLRRNPGFTATILATLGLCIGANTAIYSVVDAVLLRPLPYPEPERLVLLATAWKNNGKDGLNTAQTGTIFETVRRNVPALDVAAWAGTNGVNFAGQGLIDYVTQDRVSTGYFGVLGVRPQMGREFTPAEDTAGGPAVAVLSHGFWQRAFHQDPTVLGRAINLRGEPYTVVGIMPRGFRVEIPVDVWTPLRPSRSGEGAGSNYRVVARLRPGVSWPEANAQLLALSGSLNQDANSSRHSNTGAIPDARVEERMLPFRSGLAADTESQLLLTLGAVLMVLLIGCVNIAGLLLARSAPRRDTPTVTQAGDAANFGGNTGPQRPNLIDDPNRNLGGSLTQWFNTGAYQAVTRGVGDAPFDSTRGPGVANFDNSLLKSFQVSEWMQAQFGLETFNTFNHPQFEGVGNQLGSATFGVVTSARDPRILQLRVKITF